ncbi:MAG: type II toxin-antitoxin system VapC family toxin [Thermodesulfobacteriota bacterium]
MIAIDTNLLVRFLTRDERLQHGKAEEIIRSDSIFIPTTVLLETEWVLRFSYGYPPDSIIDSFRKLLGLANVTTTDPDLVAQAIDWHGRGLDFADALHLAASRGCDQFVTFDAAFVRKAKGLSKCQVRKP